MLYIYKTKPSGRHRHSQASSPSPSAHRSCPKCLLSGPQKEAGLMIQDICGAQWGPGVNNTHCLLAPL